MRWLLAILIVLFLALQFQLWFGEGSIAQKVELERAVAEQKVINEKAKARNDEIAREVQGLKNGMEAIEERARNDLGMIKDGETFYIVVEDEQDKAPVKPDKKND